MIQLTVCINRIEIITDRPLGDVEKKLENFCTNTLFGVSFHHIRGIAEGVYMVAFPIGRDFHQIENDITSFLNREGLEVKTRLEV
jgi:hypothetical protein